MSRSRSNNRAEALKIWIKSGREKKLSDIAEELGISASLIRKWKFLDKWDEIPVKRKRGAQPGNKNSVGNIGGAGGPEGNDHAMKHGYYAKYLPDAVLQIVQEIHDSDPLEMIWNNIILLQAKLLHGQRITHVADKDDTTKELKREKPSEWGTEEEWELQFAHDKHANASKADVLVMRELRSAIRQFLAAAPENDERRAKLELMNAKIEHTKLQVDDLKNGDKDTPTEISVKRWGHAKQ
ncbi:phage terminase small subunit [Paenibacillus sinopodophylli]|uniref:phage terminase small subunit n=1 Tax=Paenibacillus sinopodophylli TaxID=1837342 RepID=UPI00110D1F6F|nr:phage terminase small subunit [Paenibacillus sinopodophylli]